MEFGSLSKCRLVRFPLETITHRTREYARQGIYVLWLLQWTPKLDAKKYSPQMWEEVDSHTTYFGRVYYWLLGLAVVSYSFEPHLKSDPKRTWYSGKGKRMTGGGYTRRSARHRTAIRERQLNLVTDFVPRNREMWEANGIVIPDAKIFMHRN